MRKINSICIIDDDPITVFGIKKILNSIIVCDNIYTYINGKIAIDGIKEMLIDGKDMPDVLFLDINMPIMDGWQFLEEFIHLDIDKKVRVNIVTSSIDPIDKEKSELYKTRTGHTIVFINKPISREGIQKITKAA